MTQWVYSFGGGSTEGHAEMRELLGGKGANLAEMSSIGLPVPPGFTLSTEVCTWFYDHDRSYPETLSAEVDAAIDRLEKATGLTFASPENPLLLSVRSGSRASMTGMMDTVLNLGINSDVVWGLLTNQGISVLPGIPSAVSSRCTAMLCSALIMVCLKMRSKI